MNSFTTFLKLVGLVACLGSSFGWAQPKKDLHIHLLTWRGETPAEQGFKDGLAKLGYHVTFDVFNANQDSDALTRHLRENMAKFERKDYDYVYTYGTTVSTVTARFLNGKVPQIFNIVAEPVEAGIVKKIDDTGGMISGVSNSAEISLQLKNAQDLIPLKTIGTLFNPRESNSQISIGKLKSIGRNLKIELTEIRIPPEDDKLLASLTKLIPELKTFDAIYLPPDSFLASKGPELLKILNANNIKTIASIEKFIVDGALLGTVANYYTLGELAAKIIDRHQKGEAFDKIPVQFQADPKLIVNKKTLDLLGLQIPGAMAKKIEYLQQK